MKSAFTESIVEDAALAWLQELGYAVLHGPSIAVGEPAAERTDPSYRDVILEGCLRRALTGRLNPDLPHEALEDAYRKITRTDVPTLVKRNRAVTRPIADIARGEHESRTLAALRDALLPKLISGEIRVPLPEEVPA